MITCPSCNAFNPDNYQFCQFCGSKLTHEFIRSVSDDLEITSLLETASEVSEVNSTTTENSNDVEAQSQDGNHELEESIDDAIAFTRPIQLTSAPLDIE
ncbi:MAG: hypothetical protein ACK568_13890, partial [Pseudanabaena sp.]